MRRMHHWLGDAAATWQQRWTVPRLRIYEELASTNTLLLRLAARGAAHGTTVIAEEQTAGRGRRGRRWHAPPGTGLLMSVLVRSDKPLEAPGAVPIRVGALVARCLFQTTGANVRIKWPNDVLAASGAKLGGILCEGATSADGGAYIVAGIGLNITQRRADFSDDVRDTATSLLLETETAHQRGAIAGAIARAVMRHPRMTAPLDAAERADIDARHALHRATVAVDDEPAGTVLGILEDGALAVLGASGPRVIRNGTLRRISDAPAAAQR